MEKGLRRSRVRMLSRLGVPLALLVALVLGAPVGLVLAQIDPHVRDRVVPAVVEIAILVDMTEKGTTEPIYLPMGSGTIISPDGLILTNHHVIDMAAHRAQLDAWQAPASEDGESLEFALDEDRVLVLGTDGVSVPVPALDLQSLYTDLAASGLSARSVHHVHRVLHRAFSQAVRWNLLPRNPCDGATSPKAPRAELNIWSPSDADAFLIATRDHRMHAFYALALTTGMRQGELLGLKWNDIEWTSGSLAVRRALQWQRGIGLAFVEPKTARSRRKIHLSQAALAALRAHKDRQAFDRHAAGAAWNEHGLVFCDAVGDPLSPTNETKRFQRATTKTGLPRIRFHDLRHTAATILLVKGVHVKLVSEMLGHSSIVLTLDTYSHVIPAMHGEAAAAMDAVFRPCCKTS